jgi:GcrA cell cycle regulator
MWSTSDDSQLREMWDRGLSYTEIARGLGVAIKTVKMHVARLRLDRRPLSGVWTPETVELLKKMHMGGKTATAIAAAIGSSVTRNAVIGKIHRLKLPRHHGRASESSRLGGKMSAKKHRKRQGQAQPNGIVRRTKARSALAELLATADIPPPPADDMVPIEQRRALVDLETNPCRWPIGDPLTPDFHFCGGTRVEGLPYCAGHCVRAYNPPDPKSKRPTVEPRKVVVRTKDVDTEELV